MPQPRGERALYEQLVALGCQNSAADQWATAWAIGGQMTLADAVTYALAETPVE